MSIDMPVGRFGPISQQAAANPDKSIQKLPDKAKIFDQLESTELRRKIGRGIQIGATAVAVVAAAAGAAVLIGGLAATPVGWGLLGAAGVAVGVTAIGACVSKARGGSFWNEVLKPQLKGIAIGVTSVVVAAVAGLMVASGSDVGGFGGGGGGFGQGVMFSMMLGYAGSAHVDLPSGSGESETELSPGDSLSNGPDVSIEVVHGAKIAKEGKTYENVSSNTLYEQAVKFVGKGTKPNLERAARRLETIIERNPGDTVKKMELAEVCMMMGKPARAAQLYEELRQEHPKSALFAAKEVKALRKAGQYDDAISLGKTYKAQVKTDIDSAQAGTDNYFTLYSLHSLLEMQINRAKAQKPKS